MLTSVVVRQGERIALWDRRGRMELIDGPRRVLRLGRRVQRLSHHSAGPGEYLLILHRDGRREHVPGPAAVWQDPVAHAEVRVAPAVRIDANEAVVVYRQRGERVDRRVVRGPEVFVSAANEWLHEFCWHGADPKPPHRKVPRALRFTKLWMIPDQMYFDVEDVRTLDDALLKVKLMIFFELTDVERMLDQTHDVIADFINAVTADVIDFAATLPFETFKARTDRLNDLETYASLVQRAQRIGYRISKVVYRGYYASEKLQAMHDSAIEARTELALQAETERQAQELADLKLRREAERAERRRRMESDETAHKAHLEQMAHEQRLSERSAEARQELEAQRQANAVELGHARATNRERLAFLRGVGDMNVDLTRYLVAQYRSPDRLVRIDTAADPQLHLHEP